jgi:predicted RNA binding protein YcfA (HicA-like mRNA interferase family)
VSPALADVPVRKVIRALESIGFVHTRTAGSHAMLRHPDGRVAVVPNTAS